MKMTLRRMIVLLMLLGVGSVSAQFDSLSSSDADANCAVLPEQIAGQANIRYDGAANIRYDGAGSDGTRVDVLDLAATSVFDDLQYASVGNEPVALIIMDDFSTVDPDEDEDDAVEWEDAAHGWLVLQVVEDALDALPQAAQDLITVETLDLAGDSNYRSDEIVVELETLLNELFVMGIERFVVNMSFVFMACEDGRFDHSEWIRSYEADPTNTLVDEFGGDVDYVTLVLNDARVERINPLGLSTNNSVDGIGPVPSYDDGEWAFLRLFEVPMAKADPLRAFFSQRHPYSVVPVASAGNLKWIEPFSPAIWPEVLSVSATMGDTEILWPLSNNGEISAPGAFVEFPDGQYRAGTSFAAPIVSVMVALDQTQGTPQCRLTAPGAYAMEGRGNVFDDVALLDAVTDRC